MKPIAKRSLAAAPASGSSARAASPALSIEIPSWCRVAAHATTTKTAITPVITAPVTTSIRSKPRSRG